MMWRWLMKLMFISDAGPSAMPAHENTASNEPWI